MATRIWSDVIEINYANADTFYTNFTNLQYFFTVTTDGDIITISDMLNGKFFKLIKDTANETLSFETADDPRYTTIVNGNTSGETAFTNMYMKVTTIGNARNARVMLLSNNPDFTSYRLIAYSSISNNGAINSGLETVYNIPEITDSNFFYEKTGGVTLPFEDVVYRRRYNTGYNTNSLFNTGIYIGSTLGVWFWVYEGNDVPLLTPYSRAGTQIAIYPGIAVTVSG